MKIEKNTNRQIKKIINVIKLPSPSAKLILKKIKDRKEGIEVNQRIRYFPEQINK